MVQFDQLRISDDGKELFIDVHVNTSSYFKNVYLNGIVIIDANSKEKDCKSKDYTGISETNPYVPNNNYVYKSEILGNEKELHLRLTKADFDAAFVNMNSGDVVNSLKPYAKVSFNKPNFSDSLFFVYIICKGADSECTPCVLDSSKPTVGVTFDEKLLYQRVMDYTKQLSDNCTVPREFIDFILLWNGFKASIETEHYVPALKYWQMLFNNPKFINGITTKGCGCHG
nr:MAG TPA: hypothetical protein [Crassvirales sp.]